MNNKDENLELNSSTFRLILANRINTEISERNWSQTDAAKHLQTTQTRISYITNLQVGNVAEKSMFKMLALLGHKIDSQLIKDEDNEFIRVDITKQ